MHPDQWIWIWKRCRFCPASTLMRVNLCFPCEYDHWLVLVSHQKLSKTLTTIQLYLYNICCNQDCTEAQSPTTKHWAYSQCLLPEENNGNQLFFILSVYSLWWVFHRSEEEIPITQQVSLRPAFPCRRLPASPPVPRSSPFSWTTTALPTTDIPPKSVAFDSITALIFPSCGSKLPKSPGWLGWYTPKGL